MTDIQKKTKDLFNVPVFVKLLVKMELKIHDLSSVPLVCQRATVKVPCTKSKEGNILSLHENVHLFSYLHLYSVSKFILSCLPFISACCYY